MIIQHNIMATNSYNRLSSNNSLVAKNLEKLSSGYKINRAGDDAAGLAISEKMRAQITGLTRATQNAKDGVSLVQTAEGNLTEVHSMLNRMVDLATQSSNGTIDNDVDRKNLQKEVQSLKDEIDRIAESSHFNGIKLLNGTMGGYSPTTATGTPANGFATGGVLVTGGKLQNSDEIKVNNASGVVSLNTVIKIGGTVAALGSITVTAGTDNNAIAGKTGSNTFKITLTQAQKDALIADGKESFVKGIGDGVTITANVADGTKTGTATYTIDKVGLGLNLQIGDTASQRVNVKVADMGVKALKLDGVDVSNENAANTSIDTIKAAINTVSGTRADLGAIQNRLEHTINNLTSTAENMTAAESRIRDTDMAQEMMAFTKNNVLSQAAQSMLAQANQQPQQVLQLLR